MVELFLLPIREREIIEEQDIRSVFANVESILMLNSTLLQETEERMNSWDFETKLGDVFLKIVRFSNLHSFNLPTSFPNELLTYRRISLKYILTM